MAASSAGESFSSGDHRPVKLLCNLGGRILPRPSDGALRYAGGDTRIVSLPLNASISLLTSKLADSYSLSSPFLIRYQLPDEGLDSLISVSTQEDLENMMEEYEKLSGPSPKLRVFLFPMSDPGPTLESLDPTDSESSIKYLDAVNGIPRKDSLASLASVTISSPTSSQSNDASRSVFTTAPLIDVETEKKSPNPNPHLLEITSENKESSKYRQPLSQLPPLPPAFLINPNYNNNHNHNNNKERDSEYGYSEDCNLCQRHLPHAHSDTMEGKVGFAPEPLPVFHSLRPEDFNRIMAQQQVPGFGYQQFVPGTESPYQYPVQMDNNAHNHNPFDNMAYNSNNNKIPDIVGTNDGTNNNINNNINNINQGGYSSFAPVHYQSINASNLAHFNMYNNVPAYGFPIETSVAPTGVPNYLMDPVYTSIAVNNNAGIAVNSNAGVAVNSNANNVGNDVNTPVSGNVVNLEENEETVLLDPKLQINLNSNVNNLPPRPKRNASKESLVSPKDPVNNNNNNNKCLDLNVPIEEIGLNDLNEGLSKEPVRHVKGAEFVSQDLQNMEENQTHDNHVPNETKTKSVENPNSEAIKNKEVDLINLGLPNTEDLGRLQIIRNSDLEELSELGSGTFGTVYHGKWRGSDVAIKRINDRCFAGKPSEQEKMRSDFWNEASKLADLHHPNVVAFYGVVLDGPGGSIATVTEFMVNGSLRHGLQRNDKLLDRRKRLIIAMDAAFGMEYLHSKNIVHFDLKSDNLLVNLRDPHRPICKVGDLGLSKVKCQTLISGGVRGTLPWMAPELLNGSSSLVSEKVDVFSFGIVLWELLTGEEPYADLHYGVIIGGIVSNTLRPQVPETCDPEWRSLMEQCWSSEPSDRPSFTQVVARLRSMATNKTSS